MYWPVAKEIYDLKDISILVLVAMLFSWSIWGEGKMRTISVKLF